MNYNSIQFVESPSNELFTTRTDVFPHSPSNKLFTTRTVFPPTLLPPSSLLPSSSSSLHPSSLHPSSHRSSSLSPTSSILPPSSLLPSSLLPPFLLPSPPLHPTVSITDPTSFLPHSPSSNTFPSASLNPPFSLPPSYSLPPAPSLPPPEVEEDDDSEEVDILFFSMMKTNIVWQFFLLLVMAKFLGEVRTDIILGLGLGNDFINFLILKRKMDRGGRGRKEIEKIWMGRLDSTCFAAHKVGRRIENFIFSCVREEEMKKNFMLNFGNYLE